MASMRFTLLAIVLLLPVLGSAQDVDILDIIAKHPRSIQIYEEDGTIRVPKYFDRHIEKAMVSLPTYFKRPFTVPRVIRWYRESQNETQRSNLLRLLAASRDPRAAIVMGALLDDASFIVRWAAIDGLADYFLESISWINSESKYDAVKKWWENNQERLRRGVVR